MRARLHARAGRLGFFREGTHELCDARATKQLLSETCDVVERMSAALRSAGLNEVRGVEICENVAASERVAHVDAAHGIDDRALRTLTSADGLTEGPYVTDVLVLGERSPIRLRRHVLAFFQGNRYLLRDLVAHVVDQVPPAGAVLDLYAGAGLFSVAAAVTRSARVIAVEGDPFAAADLEVNAAASAAPVTAVHQAVEAFLGSVRLPFGGPQGRQPDRDHPDRDRPDAIILDPPRTGVSRDALDGVVRLGAARLIYVSCDVATLARDARRLVDAGYALDRLDAFDLFPNTPHVETVAVFVLR